MDIQRIDKLLTGEDYEISHWEMEFLKSVKSQALSGKTLTSAQLAVISRAEFKNDKQAIESRRLWKLSYPSDKIKKETFRVMVDYYASQGNYYYNLVSRCEANVDYIPTESEWKSICENKYATKVLEAHFSEALYPKGTIVQFRRTAKRLVEFTIENGGAFVPPQDCLAAVLEVDALPVRTEKKGSKVYSVLPFGFSRAYYVLERDIKSVKGKRK